MPPVGRREAQLTIVPNAAALHRAAVEEFRACAEAALVARRAFTVALSGGNTPRGVYALLAEENQKYPLAWNHVFIFFGDERHVPPDHPDSNFRMARESLLSKVPIPERNVFRVPAELPAHVAAQQYERELQAFFHLPAGAWPRFDLVLLGVGDDGHTASLFPGTAALEERDRLVAANWVEKLQSYRITLTFPVLNHADKVVFLASGKGKSQIVRDIFDPAKQGIYPSQAVQPENGKLLWIMDQDAARLL